MSRLENELLKFRIRELEKEVEEYKAILAAVHPIVKLHQQALVTEVKKSLGGE